MGELANPTKEADMDEYGSDPENLRVFRYWRNQYLQKFAHIYVDFPKEVAEQAEAFEKSESVQQSLSPETLLKAIGGMQDDPQSAFRAYHAALKAGLETIVEILHSHWQESQSKQSGSPE